jgi:hypothetical protein
LYDIELEDAILKRPYVIEANSIYRIYWDFLIILAAILNSIILPFDIAFPVDIEAIHFITFLDTAMTYIFAADVILGFNTSYINVQTGDQVYGYKFIAKEYVFRGSFFIDIISTFQLDKIYNGLWGASANQEIVPYLKIIGMVKI